MTKIMIRTRSDGDIDVIADPPNALAAEVVDLLAQGAIASARHAGLSREGVAKMLRALAKHLDTLTDAEFRAPGYFTPKALQ